MTCSDFVTRFSEYFDGTAPEEFARQAEAHLAGCSSCRRYQRVFERGREVLAAMPAPELNEDFVPRLQHRLYMADHDAVLRRHTSSGTMGFAVLGIAVLLAGVAWSATLRATVPVVDLAPIVVSRPPVVLRIPAVNAYPFDRGFFRRPAVLFTCVTLIIDLAMTRQPNL